MSETLSFDITRQELPINIGAEAFVLVELTGKERDTYFNSLGSRMKTGADGKNSGVKDFDGIEAALIAASLRRVGADGRREPVAQAEIQAWPARVVGAIFKRAQILSGLEPEEKKPEEDKEKNG